MLDIFSCDVNETKNTASVKISKGRFRRKRYWSIAVRL